MNGENSREEARSVREQSSAGKNSDGNLTFGESDTATSARDLHRFLNGPPRIAPLFADLDPSGSLNDIPGLILADARAESLTLHWVSVAYFLGNITNSFSVTLRSDGEIRMEWDALDELFGSIVGLTAGNGSTDPGSADLSAIQNGSASGTTYELYELFHTSLDLSFDAVKFYKR